MNLVSFSPTFKLNISSTNVEIRVRFNAMQNVVNQRKTLFQGGDVWNTSLLHLLLHQRRSWTALFCVFGENKKSRFSLKIRILRCFAFLCCGATGIRTRDTRIFSPLLYQLSYGTNIYVRLTFIKRVQRYTLFSYLQTFSQKIFNLFSCSYRNILIITTLQQHHTKQASPREIGNPSLCGRRDSCDRLARSTKMRLCSAGRRKKFGRIK